MTLEELYEQVEKTKSGNIAISGDRAFFQRGGNAPAEEYLILQSSKGVDLSTGMEILTRELWRIR